MNKRMIFTERRIVSSFMPYLVGAAMACLIALALALAI